MLRHCSSDCKGTAHTNTREDMQQLLLLYILSGCALADLGVVDTTADERCVGLLQNSAQFTGGVVCYSGELSAVVQQSNTSLILSCFPNTKVCKCTTCQDSRISCMPPLVYVKDHLYSLHLSLTLTL